MAHLFAPRQSLSKIRKRPTRYAQKDDKHPKQCARAPTLRINKSNPTAIDALTHINKTTSDETMFNTHKTNVLSTDSHQNRSSLKI
jgi:hypothetical protein